MVREELDCQSGVWAKQGISNTVSLGVNTPSPGASFDATRVWAGWGWFYGNCLALGVTGSAYPGCIWTGSWYVYSGSGWQLITFYSPAVGKVMLFQ